MIRSVPTVLDQLELLHGGVRSSSPASRLCPRHEAPLTRLELLTPTLELHSALLCPMASRAECSFLGLVLEELR